MKRDGQFDDSQARSEVASGHCDGIYCLGTQFIGNLLQVARVDRRKSAGQSIGVEKRLAWLRL